MPAVNRAASSVAPGRDPSPAPYAVARSRAMTAFLPLTVRCSRREKAAGLDDRAVGLRSEGRLCSRQCGACPALGPISAWVLFSRGGAVGVTAR